jgi:hypothetical protein
VRPYWRRHVQRALKQRRAVSLELAATNARAGRLRDGELAARQCTSGCRRGGLRVREEHTRPNMCNLHCAMLSRAQRLEACYVIAAAIWAWRVVPARAPLQPPQARLLRPPHHAHHSLPSCLHAQAPDSNASRYVVAPPRFALAPLADGSASRHKPSCALSAQA